MGKGREMQFTLQKVYADGSADEPQVHRIDEIGLDWHMDRRQFLSTTAVGAGVLAAVLCSRDHAHAEEIKTPEPIEVKAHSSEIMTIAFSPDGKLLASGSRDNMVKLWEMPSGKLWKTLAGHTDYITSIAFSPDGKLLASCDRSTVKLWDVQLGKLLNTLAEDKNLLGVRFGPDGKLLAARSSYQSDDTIRLWEMPSGKFLNKLENTGFLKSIAFSPDGKLLASCSQEEDETGTVKLWEMPTGKLLNTLAGHARWVKVIAFSPDGKLLASCDGYTVKLWDVQLGKLLNTLFWDWNNPTDIAFSPDGKMLVSGWDRGTVKLWEMPSGKLITSLFDPAALESGKEAASYTMTNEYGKTITYTLPCGSPLPTGAICTCDCVPGHIQSTPV